MACFAIDERSFGRLDDIISVVRGLNNLLSTIHNAHRLQVFKSINLDYVEVVDGIELCSLMYDPSHKLLDTDDRRLLIASLDRCVCFESADIPCGIADSLIAGQRVESDGILFAISKAFSYEAVGVIQTNPAEGRGLTTASAGDRITKIFSIGMTLQLQNFYRFAMKLEKVSRVDFIKWAPLAFERLRFALDPAAQIGRLKQPYETIRSDIIDHLSAINDEFVSLLISNVTLPDICRLVKSKCGVDISPEGPRTHNNARAMRERQIDLEGIKLTCEFHSKLTPTYDRIYFCTDLMTDQDQKQYLVIGPFAEHLST